MVVGGGVTEPRVLDDNYMKRFDITFANIRTLLKGELNES